MCFPQKPSLAEKFKCFGERIKQVCRRIKAFFIRIAQTICGIFDKSVSLKETVQEKTTHFSEMLQDEENRELVHFLWEQLKRLYKNPVRKIPTPCPVRIFRSPTCSPPGGRPPDVLPAVPGTDGPFSGLSDALVQFHRSFSFSFHLCFQHSKRGKILTRKKKLELCQPQVDTGQKKAVFLTRWTE